MKSMVFSGLCGEVMYDHNESYQAVMATVMRKSL